MILTSEQIGSFHQNGYLVIEDYWDHSTVNDLRNRIGEIVTGYGDLQEHDAAVFTTKEQARSGDTYFLSSGGSISFFWEENSKDDRGNFLQEPSLCINKIGHALHDLDPLFQQVSYTPHIAGICKDLGIQKPLNVQSMYIFKQPRIGGEVGAHQDGTFLYTDPQSVVGFWWALDDCTLTNGCLWAVPGSHKDCPVARQFRRRAAPETGTEFFPAEATPFDLTGAVPIECPKGTLVLLHNAVVHFSLENKSSLSRHAYSIHVVDGSPGVVYPENNWLQRPLDMPFRFIEI